MCFNNSSLFLSVENGVKFVVQSINSETQASKIVDDCLKLLKNNSFFRAEKLVVLWI